LLLVLAMGAACRSAGPQPGEFAPDATRAEESAPLGGQSLAQKKTEMRRSLRDLRHMHRTLESLAHRRDSQGFSNFSGFLDAYLGTHVDPLLAGRWQSRHPEVMALDANLRLMKAEVFILMRDSGRVQETVEDIRARYAGRENMLVEFADGKQGTLREGLDRLERGKWAG